MITTRMHGILDYIVGLALIATPWLFGFVNFEEFEAATLVPVIVGSVIIVMSLITSYELSLAKLIPMRVHLILDFMIAVFLFVSPWVLNFADYVFLPHVLAGVLIVGVFLATNRTFMEVKKTTGTMAYN